MPLGAADFNVTADLYFKFQQVSVNLKSYAFVCESYVLITEILR